MKSNNTTEKYKIGFIHPDLGFGGAERLIVDAAVGIQKHHSVNMYTQYHDENRCFEETKDGTLNVTVYGNWIPRSTFGFFHVFWAIIRMIYCTLRIIFFDKQHDIYIVDQVSAAIPFIKLFTRSKVIFYCHFPDKYLSRPGGFLKKIYRFIFDWVEEKTLSFADMVLVNSHFTQNIFKTAFPNIKRLPAVLYPSLDQASYDIKPGENSELTPIYSGKRVMASINRFERKKNHMLALESFIELRDIIMDFKSLHLVIAGGYDKRLKENVDVKQELEDFAKANNVHKQVTFVPSFTNADRYVLLHESTCILYTPRGEHFGIVPVESMYCERPIVALRSGGPKESIVDGITGLLVDIDEEDTFDIAGVTPDNSKELVTRYAQAISELLIDKKKRQDMGKAGRHRVQTVFSIKTFIESLNTYVHRVMGTHEKMD
mmetsp:Transcript_3441/g.5073  ORF Transcript_3441/g.5073 Transcript_3441/m.5073 type:complete len:430 (-) Transcript_3441:31-1320(-)